MLTHPDALIAETGSVLCPSTAATLEEMHTASHFLGGDDGRERVANDQTTKISPRQGAALHALVRGFGCRTSLEVGLARGFSTAWIMDALADQPNASHAAMAPFQRSKWRNVRLHTVNRIGLPVSFRHVEARSDDALTTLAREGFTVDFV
jgi:predicted O-methyltransferase YrrM